MKRKVVTALLTGVMACSLVLAGCSKEASQPGGNTEQTEESSETAAQTENEEDQTENQTDADDVESEADPDQAAADEVAALIDAIYVQTRTENTDAQCAQAKAAWDALTDAQKELVEGEEADPDYFGRGPGPLLRRLHPQYLHPRHCTDEAGRSRHHRSSH